MASNWLSFVWQHRQPIISSSSCQKLIALLGTGNTGAARNELNKSTLVNFHMFCGCNSHVVPGRPSCLKAVQVSQGADIRQFTCEAYWRYCILRQVWLKCTGRGLGKLADPKLSRVFAGQHRPGSSTFVSPLALRQKELRLQQ